MRDKNYGRLQPLTGAERVAYTCRDIDLEIAKVQAFQQQIVEGAQFNVASVLGILETMEWQFDGAEFC